MDIFWTKIMPTCVAAYPWGGEFNAKMSAKKWEDGLVAKVQKMTDDEFDLFLSAIVMQASRDQMMGVGLTEKIVLLRGMRK